MLRSSQALNAQIAHPVACNAYHNLGERRARWLLMAQFEDDAPGDAFGQEFGGNA